MDIYSFESFVDIRIIVSYPIRIVLYFFRHSFQSGPYKYIQHIIRAKIIDKTPGEFARANRERSKLTGWRQTLKTSPANHIRFLLVRANKFAKWKTGLRNVGFKTVVPYLTFEIVVSSWFVNRNLSG